MNETVIKLKSEFKETEIGLIPIDWEIKELGEIFNLSQGLQISTKLRIKELKQGYIPLLKITDLPNRNFSEYVSLNDIKENYIASKDDIIYTRTGQVGLVYTDVEGCVHNNCFKVHFDKNKFNKKFVYYYLKQDRVYQYSNSVATGSVQKDLTHPAFKSNIVAYPDLEEQKNIGKCISDLDEKIEINRKINENLEELGQTLFKRWFIDFEFPNEQGEPYKSSGGEMIESELGEIPKGWKVNSLDNIAEYLNGLALQKFPPENKKDYLPVIKIKELNNGITKNSDKASKNLDKKYVINNGDILFSWSGTLNVVIWCNGKGALNQHLFKVSSNQYSKWFFYLWTKYHLEEFKHIASTKATTMGHIQRKHLTDAKVLIPTEQTLKCMNNIMEPILNQQINIMIETQSLQQIRDSLLPKLMSGQIRVNKE